MKDISKHKSFEGRGGLGTGLHLNIFAFPDGADTTDPSRVQRDGKTATANSSNIMALIVAAGLYAAV